MIKKVLSIFFIGLGIIFFLLLIAAAYFFITDPLGMRRDLPQSEVATSTSEASAESAETTVEDKNPILSPTQEKGLETVGIDPTNVPSSFTPEQEACFIEILGEARVEEIKAGAAPTPVEFFRAKGCVE